MPSFRLGAEVDATGHSHTEVVRRVNDHAKATALDAQDRELVDLLATVLVDPTLHTDLRMRLHRQVSAILRATRKDLYGGSAGEAGSQAADAEDDHLQDLLTAVLVDPNLYTDLRMRLHREIRGVLRAAREPGPV